MQILRLSQHSPPMEKTLKADLRGLLGRLPLFAAADGDALDRLPAGPSEHHLPRAAVLYRQSDPCTGFFVVAHGQMKLAVTAPNGNEKVLEIINAHMSFGEAVMFLGKPFPVTAEALTESLVLGIPRTLVEALIERL